MMSVRQLSVASVTALLFAVGACDDSTSPEDLGSLDDAALTAGLQGLVEPLGASEDAVANLRMAVPDLTDAGIELRVEPGALQGAPPSLPAEFPPELAGSTFAYDAEMDGWAVDASREGAPASGVRVLWYDLNATGRIIIPPVEMGYTDLVPHAGSASDVAVTVVETRAGGPFTLLDLVQGGESSGDVVVTETFQASGTYSDDKATVDFSVASNAVTDTTSQDQEYDLRVVMDDGTTRYDMRVEGTAAGAESFEDHWTITAVHAGATTVLELVFLQAGSGTPDVSGTVVQDGTLLANVGTAGGAYTFSPPGGGSFTASQANQLNSVVQSMTVRGIQVLFALPLFGLPLFLL